MKMKTTKFIILLALLIQLARSDENCADSCHEKGTCRAYDTGRACCKCADNFVGNGINCHERESSVVIRGKLNGAIDNVKLDGLDLSGYVLTQAIDPRSFVSVSSVPSELGNKLSLILPAVTSLHWLFAGDSNNNSLNGFSLTGGVFNRQSDSTFFDEQGNVIGSLFVSQNFTGLFEDDLQIETHVDAQLPDVGQSSDDQVIYLDYDQNYQYKNNQENPETHKVVETRGSIIYKVSNVQTPDQLRSFRIEINQDTIHFVVCPELNDEKLAQSTASVKLFTKKLFTKYSSFNRRVEFSASNSIRPEEDSSPDPCDDSDCSPYAECLNNPDNDKGYDCVCKTGFEGDGQECRDVNECREGSTYCSPHAECVNILGGYECRCLPPRVGNGQTCEVEQPREAATSENRDDEEDEEARRRAEAERNDENEEDEDVDDVTSRNYCNRCDVNAQCGYEHERAVYFCRCLPGYTGDGLTCDNEGAESSQSERPTPEPETTTTEEPRTKLAHSDKCEQCHKSAGCEVKTGDGGECCTCQGGLVGNGKYCFKQGDPILIRGKVKGNLNGHKLANMDLYSYVFTAVDDTRNFIGVGQIPTELAGSFQALIGLVTPINWMFAAPGGEQPEEEDKKLMNGFLLTGGAFTRRGTLTFTDEQSGGASTTVTLTQEFFGLDNENNNELTANTEVEGQMPEIGADSQVVFKDYKTEYTYESRGVVRSSGTLEFKVTSTRDSQSFRSYKITYSDEITFSECPYSDEPETRRSASVKVNSKRVYVTYTVGDGLTKFNSVNFMHAKDSPDHPCEANRCSVYAECITDLDAPEKYVCSCKAGFEGDGFNCYDVDECQTGESGCDQNSVCYNFVGHFECRCRAPYRGNGRQCFYDFDCNSCDRNAQCVEDSSYQKSCVCNEGYEGDGLRCTPASHNQHHQHGEHHHSSGDDCDRCGEHERCEENPRTRRLECRCKEGFEKRYGRCQPLPCNQYSNCDSNADCQYSQQARKYECKCRPGYHGDGHACSSQTCDVQNNCDEHAVCVPDSMTRQYACVCTDGYLGDGYECVQDVNSCKVMRNCDHNAECLHDQRTNRHACKCRSGFEGDGYHCKAINSCTRDSRPTLDLCDENADCVYDQRANDYVCKCRPGYDGNGLRGKCFKDESQALHLVYAQGTSLQRIALRETEEEAAAVAAAGYQVHKKRLVYIPGQTAVGVAYDCQEDFIYWSDVSGRMISKIKPDGSKLSTVLQDVKSAEGLAIDWLSRNLYFTDSVDKTIEVASLNGLYRKVLIKTGLNNPRGIAVDPVEGYMFWTDWNRKSPKIERANLDGSYRQVIIGSGLGVPNGIYYDLTRQEICWGDAKNKTIECSSKDGSNRRVVSKQENIYPFDLIGFKSTIYWSDWSRKSIQTVDKETQYPGSPLNLLPGGNGRVYGVTLVVSKCPPEATNGCDRRSDCRQLCLPLPGYNYQCACSDDSNGDCLKSLRIRS